MQSGLRQSRSPAPPPTYTWISAIRLFEKAGAERLLGLRVTLESGRGGMVAQKGQRRKTERQERETSC